MREGNTLDPLYLASRDRRPEPLLDLEHELVILGRHEGVGLPLVIGTARAPDAVCVGIRRVGHIEIDHVGHLLDVDSAGCDVGGYEDIESTLAESIHGTVPLTLGHIAL